MVYLGLVWNQLIMDLDLLLVLIGSAHHLILLMAIIWLLLVHPAFNWKTTPIEQLDSTIFHIISSAVSIFFFFYAGAAVMIMLIQLFGALLVGLKQQHNRLSIPCCKYLLQSWPIVSGILIIFFDGAGKLDAYIFHWTSGCFLLLWKMPQLHGTDRLVLPFLFLCRSYVLSFPSLFMHIPFQPLFGYVSMILWHTLYWIL